VNVTTSRVNDRYILFENRAGFEGGVFQNAANLNPTQPVMANDSTYYEPGATRCSTRWRWRTRSPT